MILTIFLGFSLMFISEYLKRREIKVYPLHTFAVFCTDIANNRISTEIG